MSDSGFTPRFATFREAFCHRFRCSPEDYERRAFFKAVPFLRLPLVLPCYILAPATFDMDRDILKIVGNTRSKQEFSQQLDEFHNALRAGRSWSKRWLGLRMSGAQLMTLRDDLDPLILEDARHVAAQAAGAELASAPVPVAARVPGETRALASRKLRQSADQIMSGVPLGEVLAAAGATESELLDQLEAEARTNPTLGWLREQLLRSKRLASSEAEVDRLKQLAATQERELVQLREQLARQATN